jgi:Zn-dependent protease with chaperone function
VLLLALVPYVVQQVLVIDAAARLADPRRAALRSLRGLQLRMFASGLLPIVAFVVVAGLVGLDARLRANVEEVALWNAVFAGVLIGSFVLFLPSMLRNTWETVPLASGTERRLLAAVAARASFRCKDLLVWRTGNLMANAAIVGLTARSRVVLFSDSLLAMLSLRELASVFAHEIGHAVRHHVPIFVAWAMGFFMCADLLVAHVVPEGELWGIATLAVVFGAWYLTFGYLSRRFELEADLYSLELLHDPEGLIGALERVGGRLRDVASWRHFSTAERVRFIAEAARSPETRARLRRGLRLARWGGALLFVVAGAVELVFVVRDWPTSQVWVDLRLGRYATAAERLERGLDVEPRLAALVARGNALAAEDRAADDAASLERTAREALALGRGEEALLTIELAALRERADLVPVGLALQRILLAERDGDAAAADGDAAWDARDVPAGWREPLARFAARDGQ